MAPAHHAVFGVFALLFHRRPARCDHPQGWFGLADGGFGADLHLLLCGEHVGHEDGARRQYKYGVGHVDVEHDSRTGGRLSDVYGQPRRGSLQPRCGDGALPEILCLAHQTTRLPQRGNPHTARLGRRSSTRRCRASRLRSLPRQKTPLVAAELFHAFLPTSAGRNRKTLGQQRRSACGRSQQQHLAADSFGVGRHARAV